MKKTLFLVAIATLLMLAACGESISPTIEDFKIESLQDDRLVVTFNTNLPDDVELDVMIKAPHPEISGFGAAGLDDPYAYPKVKGGKLIGWFPSANKYGISEGYYWIVVSILPNQKALGEKNERLAGEHVTSTPISKAFELRFQHLIPAVSAQE